MVGTREAARNALTLWEVCRKHLESEIDTRTIDAIKREDANSKELEVRGRIRRPLAFPTSHSDFERLVVGGENTTKRHQRFVKFIREYALPMKNHPRVSKNFIDLPQATEEEVSTEVQRTREERWNEQFYYHRAQQFQIWEQQTIANKASKGGKGLSKKMKAQAVNANPPGKKTDKKELTDVSLPQAPASPPKVESP